MLVSLGEGGVARGIEDVCIKNEFQLVQQSKGCLTSL